MSRVSIAGCAGVLSIVVGLGLVHRSGAGEAPTRAFPDLLQVDPTGGDDRNSGTAERPLKTISAALERLPDPLTRSVTIRLAAGKFATTGGRDMSPDSLELMRRMRPGVAVRFVGSTGASGEQAVLAWEGGSAIVRVTEGCWSFDNVQIGSGSVRQRRGIEVSGSSHVDLKNVTFRTRSQSDAGIYAHWGGQVFLYGAIRMNEHLHDAGGEETFCGIVAQDHGLVAFREHEGASLDMGNGSLSASYYGCIRLGCATARITSWAEQSNNLAINNGGRIDLHDTHLMLSARRSRNTPIGLEHDGHILGEGARVTIESSNDMAIALQKASTFTCNAIELKGKYKQCVWASSGSMFVGRFLTDVGRLEATTGAGIHVEKIDGAMAGPAVAEHCGVISLPDRNIFSAGS